MHYHHLYSDDTGESRWRTVEVDLQEKTFAPPAKAIFVSASESAKSTMFLRLAKGWDEPIHPTPKRQFLIALAGCVEVTASDGEMRVIGPGAVWRMEDRTGEGHHTKVVSDEDFEAVMVQFD